MPAAFSDAELACAAGNCRESIERMEEDVRHHPGDFRLHYKLGICYSGCCKSHPLVHPEMAVPYLRQALQLLPANPGVARAAVLDQIGNALIERAKREGAESLCAAIETHRSAAEAFLKLRRIDDWARVQFNLGNSYCELSDVSGEDHWEEAVEAYRKALLVRTRHKDPEQHAMVLENLGTAYRHLADVSNALRCFRASLHVHTAAAHPEKCAALHNNLGNLYLSIPDATVRNSRRHMPVARVAGVSGLRG